jgi:hypothetical protein
MSWVSHTQGRFGEQRQQANEEKHPDLYFSQFLAKPGAGRAHIRVFGHSGAIEVIYFAL